LKERVVEAPADAVLSQRVDERPHFLLVLRPCGSDGCQVAEPLEGLKRGWGDALPSRIPHPLGAVGVRQRVPDRSKAVAQIARELLRRERLNRVEHPIARPVMKIEERA
jgi:hypothetical protein